MTNGPYILEADLTWTGRAFEPGIRIAIDARGMIEAVGSPRPRGSLGIPNTAATISPLSRESDLRLRDRAILPGFVNVHSHAFQRALRGRGERFPAGAGSFWTWRQAMYDLVERLGPDEFHRRCVQAFQEMLRSGITTVGEFHYFHHTRGTEDWAFDRLVLDAAREVGIRIVLLNTHYRTGGVGRPLEAAQRRFDTVSPTVYWDRIDALAGELDPMTQHLGAVAHSIRAATPDDIAALHEESLRRGLVFHLHVEEQRKEIEECETAYGLRPMALLNKILSTARNVTAVHCTHTAPEDMARFLDQGGSVCACPLTEGNLGDGVPDHTQAFAAGRLCLGTDSNARIAFSEEMRWLEYVQRLRTERRGALRPDDGHVARALLEIATENSARALGLNTGRIAPGLPADFCTIDLTAPELIGADEDTLLDAFIFGAGASVVRATCVAGRWHR